MAFKKVPFNAKRCCYELTLAWPGIKSEAAIDKWQFDLFSVPEVLSYLVLNIFVLYCFLLKPQARRWKICLPFMTWWELEGHKFASVSVQLESWLLHLEPWVVQWFVSDLSRDLGVIQASCALGIRWTFHLYTTKLWSACLTGHEVQTWRNLLIFT